MLMITIPYSISIVMFIILIVNSVVLSFFELQNFYYSYSLLTSISIHLLSIY